MEKELIIVIDAQNDFEKEDGALYVPGSQNLIPLQNQFLSNLNPDDVEAVIFTFDTHYSETYPTSEEAQQFNIHCVKDTHGWDLAVDPSLIKKEIPVLFLEKGKFSMWEESDLTLENSEIAFRRDDYFSDMLEKGIRKVRILGVASDFCVLWAIQGLLYLGFEVIIEQNLVKGIFREIDQVVEEEKLKVTLN